MENFFVLPATHGNGVCLPRPPLVAEAFTQSLFKPARP